MTHPYKEILIAIANGEQIQWKDDSGEWCNQSDVTTLREIASGKWPPDDFRIKPKIILINGHEVPEPVRAPLEKGQPYFLSDCTCGELASHQFWDGMGCEFLWLERGLIHLTEEAAKQHSDALLSFTKRG